MKKGDIISVITVSGEYIGKLDLKDFSSESGDIICLEDPRMIVQGPEGQMGFAQGVAVTGEKNPTSMQIQSYVFITKTNDQVAEAYRTHLSGIELPSKNLIVDK
tara:strand:- start:1861 stop:2172 length:312 start_codon:yes stop_codon:yes gene_type:complete